MAAGTKTGTLDDEEPWHWSLRDVMGLLDDRQRRYVELLPRLFKLKTAHGKIIPYNMQPYQAWWHAHAPLAMRDAPSRLVEKGRGLGLTTLAAMDALLLAHTRNGVTLPVAGRAGDTSDEFIERCHDLMANATEEDFFDHRHGLISRIELGNGSRILPMPGGSPDKVRSKRVIHAVLDEFAFHPYAEKLWRAMRGSQSEGGTLDVISTHDGAGTNFYRILEETRAGRLPFKRFWFPIHEPNFKQSVPVSQQVREGQLKLIAPWIDTRLLDEFRLEDPAGYNQEMLCDVMDAALNVLSRAQVDAASTAWPDWGRPIDPVASVELSELGVTVPHRPSGDLDPFLVGVDFARSGDLSAYVGWSLTPEGPRQRWVQVLHGVDTPAQNVLLREVDRWARFDDVLIDMTGNGTGLHDYARRDFGDRAHGVHFAQTVAMSGATGKVQVKKVMALTLGRFIGGGEAALLREGRYSDLQRRHLTAVRRSDLDAAAKEGEGHADLFWANALALWGARLIVPRRLDEDAGGVDVTDLLRRP